jgi:hypothetical protein
VDCAHLDLGVFVGVIYCHLPVYLHDETQAVLCHFGGALADERFACVFTILNTPSIPDYRAIAYFEINFDL